MAPVRVEATRYILRFDAEDVYWPTYWDQALNTEGELLSVAEYQAEAKFEAYLWDQIDGIRELSAENDDTGYLIVVESTSQETEDTITDLVEKCVQSWNDLARSTEQRTLEWFEQLQSSQDPLDMGDFDIMI
jgi:hypothetical protein